jgi:hypothetical protein
MAYNRECVVYCFNMQLETALREALLEDLSGPALYARIQKDDPRSPLGGLLAAGRIPINEYNAAIKWRNAHLYYLHSIQSPDDLTDGQCVEALKKYKEGVEILMDCGNRGKSPYGHSRRVFHAVCALATYEETLGDFDYMVKAARVGFAALAKSDF